MSQLLSLNLLTHNHLYYQRKGQLFILLLILSKNLSLKINPLAQTPYWAIEGLATVQSLP